MGRVGGGCLVFLTKLADYIFMLNFLVSSELFSSTGVKLAFLFYVDINYDISL